MSVRSFHSVFMATAVAGAALGCYLVSLRVASERAALEQVEYQIVHAQRDIRLLQTEIGTRARLAQLERWNVRVLALSAPSPEQILGDKFQLARLVRPEHRSIDAPVVLASAPAPQPQQPLAEEAAPAPAAQLLHTASLKLEPRKDMTAKAAPAPAPKKAEPVAPKPVATATSRKPEPVATKKPAPAKADVAAVTKPAPAKAKVAATAPVKPVVPAKKAGDKPVKAAAGEVTRKTQTASVDPLAPLPGGKASAKGSPTKK
ncbi:hypothetical protein H8M03_11015 [Sphingomonas sabuli]|uniref:Uncharacterized protein n=1 Tax=Sphingomonas sabuli TaxID=2764186 RepID=A0A7G9L1M3_9SPHN|nr:hypothetical protein [Sphingomonas sabuli]QNM82522.1 hypothetical protein H8M03_11015 [Sphingomonas sabuli]